MLGARVSGATRQPCVLELEPHPPPPEPSGWRPERMEAEGSVQQCYGIHSAQSADTDGMCGMAPQPGAPDAEDARPAVGGRSAPGVLR